YAGSPLPPSPEPNRDVATTAPSLTFRVHAVFTLDTPQGVPFPSIRFTAASQSQNTGQRVAGLLEKIPHPTQAPTPGTAVRPLGGGGSGGGGVSFQEWSIPTPNSQPHDIISDDQGIIWFTEIAANQIGRFDPATETFMEFALPTPGGNPHGICVAPDNGIWFT